MIAAMLARETSIIDNAFMSTQIIFETHSLSEDNGRGVASGWHHSRLSEQGRALAEALGKRRREGWEYRTR